MRVLLFAYTQWDDDKGPGWDSFRGLHEVETIEEARSEIAKINNFDVPRRQDGPHDDYQIVDAVSFELLERGTIEYEWAADENTVINSRTIPEAEQAPAEGI